MHIGVDARALSVPMFGIGRYTQRLLHELVSHPNSQWFLYSDRPIIHRFDGHENVTHREFSQHNKWASLFRTQISFAKWSKQDRLDVFWSPRHHLPILLDRRVKKVLTIHDMVWRRFPETMSTSNYWVERLLMPMSLSKADAVIAVSESTQRDILDFDISLLNRISVIHEAASQEVEPSVRQFDGAYFLFVGTLEPRKNISTTLKAYRRYRELGGEKQLLMVGAKGWKLDSQKNEVGVSFLGRVSDEVLASLYKHAYAFLYPSLYEGFGLPALEAMTFGVPVIGSNSSSIPEVVGGGGILVNPLDANEIAFAMTKLEQSEDFRNELGEIAKTQADKFSWPVAASETMAQFEEVLKAF